MPYIVLGEVSENSSESEEQENQSDDNDDYSSEDDAYDSDTKHQGPFDVTNKYDDVETGDATCRLAIMNCDWTHFKAKDIL